jgi:hypothetical protein
LAVLKEFLAMSRSVSNVEKPARKSRWGRHAPVVALLLLSPIVSELLSGSTRLTTLLVLIPATGAWGCAAIVIREAARRRGRTWRSILMLGIALAVAEECVIQQTSLAPLITMDPDRVYSRAFGVNWEYFLWALGFESVWAVVLPIAMTEYLFPDRAKETWLGARGLAIAATVFALASFVAWYAWTQVFVPKFFPKSVYHPPAAALALALLAIVVLVMLALAPSREIGARSISNRPAPRPWVVGLVSFVLALAWYLQIMLAFGAMRWLPVGLALAGGLALGVIALIIANRWSARRAWGDDCSFAAILGILAATLAGGIVTLNAARALPIDRVGQVVFNLAAIGFLGWRKRRRDNARAV